MPKYVISSTPVDGNIVVHGSAMLVHSLLEHGLVDELRLMIFPVILGSGKRVFPETPDKITLEPADTRTYGEIVVHTYRPAGTR
jgi:dihydrofolate reductase